MASPSGDAAFGSPMLNLDGLSDVPFFHTGFFRPKAFIIEHLDPELGEWTTLEYAAIATECSHTQPEGSTVCVISGVPKSFALPDKLRNIKDLRIEPKTIEELCTVGDVEPPDGRWKKERVCLLDPKAERELGATDADLFDAFLFGGILGDDPPQDRTGILRAKGFETRRLGAMQMTTDTAARVTRLVVCSRIGMDRIHWVDNPEITINKNEKVTMPFRYIKGLDGKAIMPDGMVELIKNDAEKGLDGLF